MSLRNLSAVPFLVFLTILSGCGGGLSRSTTPPPAATITSIAITPASLSLNLSATQQLTANANYSDRTAGDITSSATWASSNTAVATVSSSGLVTAVAPGTADITASDAGQKGTASITVNSPQRALTAIAVSPQNPAITAGNTVQLRAVGTYSDSTTADITESVTWNTSVSSVATVNGSGLVSGVAAGTATITAASASIGGRDTVTISSTPPPAGSVNITTFHFDNKRSGLNNSETTLTPANVNSQSFGKLFSVTVDGYVYAQPLYMSGLTINGTQHNVVLVSTEKNNVYAFDADSYNNNTPLWHTSLLKAGESPASGGNPAPYHGSTSTPVIDAGSDIMYAVTAQNAGSGNTYRLNAIDIKSGNIVKTAAITAQVTPAQNSDSVNGTLTLPSNCVQRTALLLDNGTIYFGFSACDSGWLLAYDEATLAQKGVFAVGPNNDGNGDYKGDGGVWMGGSGALADGAGGVYITTGNGPYNNTSQAYGDSILRFDSSLTVKDWFTPADFAAMQCQDQDLSGGGAMLMPNGNIVAGGKSGKIFQVDSGNLGQGPHSDDSSAIATLYPGASVGAPYPFTCSSIDTSNPPNGQPYPMGSWNGTKTPYQLFGTAAYYNNSVYVGTTPGGVVQLALDSGKLTVTSNVTKEQVATNSYGTTPVVSANNNTNAVLWFIDHGAPLQEGTPTAAILRAYNPSNLAKELYDSNMSSSDTAGFGVKFSAPVVANGKVYIATANDSAMAATSKGEIDVYGLK